MVIGTTGLDASQENDIAERSRNIPIVFAPNMSIGVNLLFKIVKEAAGALSGDFDIRIDETHHIHKKDSPSGTAKMINKVIKEASGQDVPIKAFREGEVIGNHGIMFESEFETLEIRHNAKTRDVFAAGALKAAKFLKDKSSRLYTMADVLGIE
jgi:4-hydroxy-tetrahydrodipicolinate reductase